jgi:DNA-binding NarL/FixJ family response regulator
MASYNSAGPSAPKSGDEGPSAHSSEIPEAIEVHGPCLRVFLVEDSASVRERLGDFLSEPGKVEMIGYAATEAEAVRQLATQPVDVAIVDLNLKEGTGIGVIESVRALHATPPPTIVVLTNYAFPEFEAACRERGADYFFDKSTQFGAVKMLLQSIRRSRH